MKDVNNCYPAGIYHANARKAAECNSSEGENETFSLLKQTDFLRLSKEIQQNYSGRGLSESPLFLYANIGACS